MKKLLVAAAATLAAFLPLAARQIRWIGVTTIGGISVADVQNDAVAICSYLPTASTVANIVSANNPAVVTAEAVAAAICGAVAPPKAARYRASKAALPFVYIPPSVQIQGNFVH